MLLPILLLYIFQIGVVISQTKKGELQNFSRKFYLILNPLKLKKADISSVVFKFIFAIPTIKIFTLFRFNIIANFN